VEHYIESPDRAVVICRQLNTLLGFIRHSKARLLSVGDPRQREFVAVVSRNTCSPRKRLRQTPLIQSAGRGPIPGRMQRIHPERPRSEHTCCGSVRRPIAGANTAVDETHRRRMPTRLNFCKPHLPPQCLPRPTRPRQSSPGNWAGSASDINAPVLAKRCGGSNNNSGTARQGTSLALRIGWRCACPQLLLAARRIERDASGRHVIPCFFVPAPTK